MRFLNALLLASALIASPLAFAEHDGGDHCDRHMSKADKNSDGSIDKTEAQAMHEKHFAQADVNKDGKLSQEEMNACKHDGMEHGKQEHGKHEHTGN
jgi:hypothetical protein